MQMGGPVFIVGLFPWWHHARLTIEGKELRVVGVCQLIPLQVRFLWPCLIDSGAWDEVRFPLVTVLVLLYVVMLQK
jgi:hypothetical protein